MIKRYKILSEIKPTGFCLECGVRLEGRKEKYCSEECQIAYYRKNDAITFRDYIRDKYKKCQYEGCSQESELEVHHIKPLSEGGELFDEDNVIFLCKEHHREMHRKMHRKINTKKKELKKRELLNRPLDKQLILPLIDNK